MYRTQLGERVLGEKEGAVFREMLAQLLTWFDPGDESMCDEETTSFGIPIFDRMSYGQKLWSLHLVTRTLLLESEPCPPLHAYVEGTVATVFTQAEVLLDMENEGWNVPFRKMLTEAATEICDGITENDAHEFGYEFLVESLEDCILWDNDYLNDADSMDRDPDSVGVTRALLGVPDDYFVEIPEDPNDNEFRRLFDELIIITKGSGESLE